MKNFDYYPGCTLKNKARELDEYARKAAAVLGIGLNEADAWQCCGAVHVLGTDEYAAKLPSVRVLKAAKDRGRDVVTLCSACHHVLKNVNYEVTADKDFARALSHYDEDVNYTGGVRVLHFLEVLHEHVGWEKLSQMVKKPLTGRKIGAFYGCMLLRPGGVMDFDDPENPSLIEGFINALGAEVVRYPMRNQCCGGYISLTNNERAAQMSQIIVDDAKRLGTQELITACPLCAYNVEKRTDSENTLPISYFTKLLAEALDV